MTGLFMAWRCGWWMLLGDLHAQNKQVQLIHSNPHMTTHRLLALLLFSLATASVAGTGEMPTPAQVVAAAWPQLDSPDRSIREAARTAIESQPVAAWQELALGERRTWAALEAMLALTRRGQPDVKPHLCEGITTLTIEQMSEEQQLAAMRLTGLVFTRLGAPTEDERAQMGDLWMRFFPAKTERLNRELVTLCASLDAPGTVEKTMSLLRAAKTRELQIHYATALSKPARPLTGWTPALRREHLEWLRKAASESKGDKGIARVLAEWEKDQRPKTKD